MIRKKKKPVILIIAHDGFQYAEYTKHKKLLEQNGYTVITASNQPGNARGNTGAQKAHVNMLVNDIKPKKYAGIFFLGGQGALDSLNNPTSYRILREAHKHMVPHGATCIATRILAKAGVLKNKTATGWNGDETLPRFYHEHGGRYLREEVVVDENLITGTGTTSIKEFGTELVHFLAPKKIVK